LLNQTHSTWLLLLLLKEALLQYLQLSLCHAVKLCCTAVNGLYTLGH
jgi:hypothetical protein